MSEEQETTNLEENTKTEDSLVNQETKTDESTEQKTEEQKTTEQKTEEVKDEVVPLTVEDFVAPEGFEIQPEMANEFLGILNGEMEPKDKANALIALHSKTINAALEADSKAWENMQTEWKDTVKADPDIGGDKLQPTLTNISKLLDEFGNDELKGVFDLTGAGNNVHMIKFLGKIADTLTEGRFFKAGTPGGNDDPDAAAKRLFPTMKG